MERERSFRSYFNEGPTFSPLRADMAVKASVISDFFQKFRESFRLGDGEGEMRNRLIWAVAALLLAVSVASGATLFARAPATGDFCAGYEICAY
ncbi:MAG: hypothetical protein N2444_03405 [Methylocystis sp.]|nr:hypothetical protein [Methylocystis sp.]